jgi:drug/metabolite transporter (DMT)-like permease
MPGCLQEDERAGKGHLVSVSKTVPTATWMIALALGVVYGVWGSTYLAIRVAVEGMPPFLMAGLRFLVASGIMLLAGLAARHPWPTWRQIGWAAVVGQFLLVGGNGMVVWAERVISSGMAALLVASVPLWIVLIEAVVPGGTRPRALGVMGICLGFVGVALLMGPDLTHGAQSSLAASGLVVLGALLWAIGTLIGRRVLLPSSGIYNSAFTMLSGALGFFVAALLAAEPAQAHWSAVPMNAWLALAYLVVFGSCVAFSAYTWLVQRIRPDLLATYAYVNPAVAVVLGALILHERVDAWILGGAALIIASVALVIQGSRQGAS